jgi:cell division protein FtsB
VTEAAQAASAPTRPLRSLVGLLVGLALLALAVAGLKGWRDYQGAQAHERRLEGEISDAQGRIHALESRIDRLQHDPATLDQVAREELGLVRPDEVVVVLPPPQPQAPAAAQPSAPR